MTAYNFKKLLESFNSSAKKCRLTEGNWYGVDGVEFIWHGEWSDPELKYKGQLFNSHDVEDPLWDDYSEDCKEEGKTPTEDEFDNWVLENKHLVYDYLDNLIDAGAGKPADDEDDYISKILKNRIDAKNEGYDAKAQADIDAFLDTKIGKKMKATSDIMAHIEAIMNDYNNGKDISYGDLAYLQNYQDFIKEYYSDDPKLWELAGIPEEEWRNKGESSITMQEDEGMVTIDTLVPGFPGFYETILERYTQHQDEIGKIWVDIINEAVAKEYPSLTYKFTSIHSPRAYNFETDSVYADATFNKDEIIGYLEEHKGEFNSYAKDNFSSYDGFMSFVPNNATEFINDMRDAEGNELNRYLQGAVEFVLADEIEGLREELYDTVLGNVEEDIVYIILAKTEDGQEMYYTYKGTSFEVSQAMVAYSENEAQNYLKDAQKEYPNEPWEIRALTERDLEDYDPSYFNN